jgi:hypothetical protein
MKMQGSIFPSLNPILKQHFMSDHSPNNTSFNGEEYKNKTEIQQQRSWLQRIP